MITSDHGGARDAVRTTELVRRLAAVRRVDADPDRPVRLDRGHAAIRGRRRPHGDPLHRANLAIVLLPRLLGRDAGAALFERLVAMAAPQPPSARRHLHGI